MKIPPMKFASRRALRLRAIKALLSSDRYKDIHVDVPMIKNIGDMYKYTDIHMQRFTLKDLFQKSKK